MAFGAAAAAACAPLIYVLLERDSLKSDEALETQGELLGVSSAMEEVRRLIRRAASSGMSSTRSRSGGTAMRMTSRR